MKNHLSLSLDWLQYNNVPHDHPVKEMEKLGITYQHSVPQTMGNCWWFFNCENIPDPLPGFLTVLEIDPMKAIGFGLSKEEAEKISDFQVLDSQNENKSEKLINVHLSKKDLASLVKGTSPNFDLHSHPLVKKSGRYYGGFNDEWNWNYGFENNLSEEELWDLYVLCRDSWK